MITAALLAAMLTADAPPRVQWIVYGAEWCGPCKRARADYQPWMEASGWTFGDNGHVRFVDCDVDQVMMVEHDIEFLPTFCLMRDGKEVRRYRTYPGKRVLVSEYLKTWEKMK